MIFGERRRVRGQRTVYLIGGHVVKTVRPDRLVIQPPGFSRLQKRMGSHHIGADEIVRTQNRPVYMRFSCEIDHRVDLMLLQQGPHYRLVANITTHERKARVQLDIFETFVIAGIGQRVIHHDLARGSIR